MEMKYVKIFNLSLWKISNTYKSREKSLMNCHVPTRYPMNLSMCQRVSGTFQQLQQLSTCDQSCFFYTPPHYLPDPRLGRKQFEGDPRYYISCVNISAFTTPAASNCSSILQFTLWLLLVHSFAYSCILLTACPLCPL